MKKKFRLFEDARKFVHLLNLKNKKEWEKYYRSGMTPDDIPSNPNRNYNEEWRSWGDWLGTGFEATKTRKYRSFDDARKYVHSLKIESYDQWLNYARSSKRPKDIPFSPYRNYKKEWKDWGDWLGTFTQHTKPFLLFYDARIFVRSLKLKNEKEWREYCKSNKKPKDIPATPSRNYKKEWKGVGDWLGTGTMASSIISKNYLSFVDARNESRELAKKYNLKTFDDWSKAVKEGKIPKNIPLEPNRVYSKRKKK